MFPDFPLWLLFDFYWLYYYFLTIIWLFLVILFDPIFDLLLDPLFDLLFDPLFDPSFDPSLGYHIWFDSLNFRVQESGHFWKFYSYLIIICIWFYHIFHHVITFFMFCLIKSIEFQDHCIWFKFLTISNLLLNYYLTKYLINCSTTRQVLCCYLTSLLVPARLLPPARVCLPTPSPASPRKAALTSHTSTQMIFFVQFAGSKTYVRAGVVCNSHAVSA